MRTFILTAAIAGLFAAPAFAQTADPSRVYGSIGYAQLSGDAYDFDTVTARLGAKLNRYIGVEGEASAGVSEETFDFSIGGESGTIEHKYDVAAYAVGFLPVRDNIELFARVGYGSSEVESSVPSVSVSQDGESVNYGVGANIYLYGGNGLRADWTRRDFREEGGEVDAWSLSYIRRF